MAGRKKKEVDSEDLLATIVDQSNEDIYGGIFSEENAFFVTPKHFYSLGVPPIDALVGGYEGGLACGKITEIYGGEASGKSEFVQLLAHNFLVEHPTGIVIYYDIEGGIDDKKIAARPMFKNNRCAILKAKNIESLLRDIETKTQKIHEVKTGTPVLMIVDSLKALVSKIEQDGEIGDQHYAPIARAMSSGLPHIVPILEQTTTHLVFVNQVREDIGGSAFAELKSPGGRALKFFATYRIKSAKTGKFYFKTKSGDDKGFPDGAMHSLTTVKNRRVPPLRKVEIPIIYTANEEMWGPSGFNPAWSVFSVLQKNKYIKQGKYCHLEGHEDEKFTKEEWGKIYRDTSHPLYVPIQTAFEDWKAKLFGATSLGYFPEIEVNETVDESELDPGDVED